MANEGTVGFSSKLWESQQLLPANNSVYVMKEADYLIFEISQKEYIVLGCTWYDTFTL